MLILISAASLGWIYFRQFAAPKVNVALHTAVAQVMAEQTAQVLGGRGKIVVIAMDTPKGSELKIQLEEFERALKHFPGVTISKTYMLETENRPKYGPGSGLSGRRFVRAVNKNTTADAMVSFVGAPDLSDEEIGQLQARPKFIAETRSAAKLRKLFDKQLIHVAIVSRYQFPAPVEGNPVTLRQWFDKRFQILTAEAVSALPAATAE
jgi:hypothetical protein